MNGIIAISRAIGDWEYKNPQFKAEDNMVTAVPELQVEHLRPDHDFMIIACDGIWDCLTSQQAVDFVYETREKLLRRGAAGASSSTLKASKTIAGAGARKGGISPVKKHSTTTPVGSTASSSALSMNKSNSTSVS